MEESDLLKTKVTLSFTVWTGFDEMIKIEEAKILRVVLSFKDQDVALRFKIIFFS